MIPRGNRGIVLGLIAGPLFLIAVRLLAGWYLGHQLSHIDPSRPPEMCSSRAETSASSPCIPWPTGIPVTTPTVVWTTPSLPPLR